MTSLQALQGVNFATLPIYDIYEKTAEDTDGKL